MPASGRHLDAGNELEVVAAAGVHIARQECASDVVVVGDGDDIKLCAQLDQIEDLLGAGHAIALSAVDL